MLGPEAPLREGRQRDRRRVGLRDLVDQDVAPGAGVLIDDLHPDLRAFQVGKVEPVPCQVVRTVRLPLAARRRAHDVSVVDEVHGDVARVIVAVVGAPAARRSGS